MKYIFLIIAFFMASFSAKAELAVVTDYAVTPVTTAAYVQLVAQMPYATNKVQIFDSSGQTLFLAVGAPGQEQVVGIIPPGGQDLMLTNIGQNQRVSIKAVSNTVSTDATAGENVIVFLKTL